MRNSTQIRHYLIAISAFILSQKMLGQEGKVTVTQDTKFEQLLNDKRKINNSITINDRYKIQIFNGDSENSKKTLIDFKKDNTDMDATIVFSTPLYKVWVGNFKTRIEAEKNLKQFKEEVSKCISNKT